jgi:hypothetical protein
MKAPAIVPSERVRPAGGRRGQGQLLGEPGAGHAAGCPHDLLGRARGDDAPAVRSATGAHVDEPVGGGEEVKVVVDDDDGGAGREQVRGGLAC